MSDPRIATVLEVLRANGVQTNEHDTDTLATMVVNALDREHGSASEDVADVPAGNPETPLGTGVEGGSGDPAQ